MVSGRDDTAIIRNVMKELLLFCTRNAHFTLDGCVYLQNDGLATGSSSCPIFAGQCFFRFD